MQPRAEKKAISVVFIGHIHREPAVFSFLTNLVLKHSKQGIEMVFCPEDSVNISLEDAIKHNEIIIKQNNIMLQDPFNKNLLKQGEGLSYSFFPLDVFKQLSEHIKIVTQYESSTISNLTWQLIQKNSHIEYRKLLSVLKDLGIPYTGIEISKVEHKKILNNIYTHAYDDRAYLSHEQLRCDEMTNNIFSQGVKKISARGIVFVFGGINHTHRLAAKIHKKYHDAHTSEYDLKIFTLNFFSPYVLDGVDTHRYAVQESRENDPEEILDLYKHLPIQEITLKEVNGQFFAENLEEIEAQILAHVKSPSVLINNKNLLLKSVEALPEKSADPRRERDYPELDYRRKFINGVKEIINNVTFKPNEKESSYLISLSSALEENNPYNAIHRVLKEIGQINQTAFLSTFRSNMEPIRKDIITLMHQYNSDKKENSEYLKKTI